MSLNDLGQWYYLIYLLPFGLSFFMILLSTLGSSHRGGHRGVRMGHGHGSVRIGHGHGSVKTGTVSSHRLAHGHGIRGGHAPRTGHTGGKSASHASQVRSATARSHAHSGKTAHSPTAKAPHGKSERSVRTEDHAPNPLLNFFGAGRVPSMMLMQGFALAWGAAGFYGTRMLQSGGAAPNEFLLPALGMATLGGIVGAKVIGELGSRIMPSEETFAMCESDLLGQTGRVVYPVSINMGRIHVYDAFGTLHDESARLCFSDSEPLPKGESVLLVDYDETLKCFLVERMPVL